MNWVILIALIAWGVVAVPRFLVLYKQFQEEGRPDYLTRALLRAASWPFELLGKAILALIQKYL